MMQFHGQLICEHLELQFRKKDDPKPGIVFSDLSKDQLALVEKVMRDILSPYRKQDVDEVMQIVKTNGELVTVNYMMHRNGTSWRS